MHVKKIFFLIQYIIYSDHYDFIIGKPMFGPNVRDACNEEFPFVVSISQYVSGRRRSNDVINHICTGSLITRQDVLTAAHCYTDEIEENVEVIIGSTNLNNGTRYDPLWWITYNEWAEYMGITLDFRVNDIANLRLLDAVPDNIDLAILSDICTTDLYGDEVAIAGWGRNEQHVVPVNMRTVELTVLSLETCRATARRLAGKVIKIHRRHICTQANPHAVMYWGDSGSPILHMGMIVAVHKSTLPFVDEPLNTRKINVHTTIDYYRDFIMYAIDPDFYWGEINSSDDN